MPGRHQNDTLVPGGDGAVLISDELVEWTKHPFTHNAIFEDFQLKTEADPDLTAALMRCYFDVVVADVDPTYNLDRGTLPGIHRQTLLYAMQVLSVIEHRRYSQHEAKFGGRYLPLRFAAGIVEGLWTNTDCLKMQRRGRPGVEILEKVHGTPVLTKELMQ